MARLCGVWCTSGGGASDLGRLAVRRGVSEAIMSGWLLIELVCWGAGCLWACWVVRSAWLGRLEGEGVFCLCGWQMGGTAKGVG